MRDDGRSLAWAAGWILALAGATAGRCEVVPARGTVDNRIRAVSYEADQVYRLNGAVGYQIDLEFEPGETFIGLAAGDLAGLSYEGRDNHLFLKPKAAQVATNLTVLTSRRHYYFEYSARVPYSASDVNMIFALRFTYPASTSLQAADAAAKGRIDADLAAATRRRTQNLDYWYCGSPALKPVLAADDGVHTRLRFAANADLPAIFVLGEDGESLVNFSMDDGDVVIHRLARRFLLRRGKLTGCVVNRSFAGGGTRLDSGTVTPTVERRLQENVP